MSDGSTLLEVEPAILGKKIGVRLDHREFARFDKPNGQQPWIEHALPNDEHSLVLVLVWLPQYDLSFHLFVDGRNVAGGDTLDEWRARAPKPMDRYQQNVIHGWALQADDASWGELPLIGGGCVGVCGGGAAAVSGWFWPLVILAAIAVWIAMTILIAAWLALVKQFALWLGTKRTWSVGLRAEAVFLLLISPLFGLFFALWLATR